MKSHHIFLAVLAVVAALGARAAASPTPSVLFARSCDGCPQTSFCEYAHPGAAEGSVACVAYQNAGALYRRYAAPEQADCLLRTGLVGKKYQSGNQCVTFTGSVGAFHGDFGQCSPPTVISTSDFPASGGTPGDCFAMVIPGQGGGTMYIKFGTNCNSMAMYQSVGCAGGAQQLTCLNPFP
ncbi:hypothetical protein DFJ74DRAFT_771037 [Hyaloraphidium curvatum]|nr:hypothetical protein DFJ74DRAFT_771037 [Hyaloraphidium curvatum]